MNLNNFNQGHFRGSGTF